MQEIGVKMGKQGYWKSIQISFVQDVNKMWHVGGSGTTINGESYDYFQIWIPKSVSIITYNHMGGAGLKDRNRIVIPKWLYDKLKVYHIAEDKARKLSRESHSNIEYSDAVD